jgi:hypothetical protein
VQRGIISMDSVQGGSILDSYEARIPETNLEAPIKLVMLSYLNGLKLKDHILNMVKIMKI